MKRRRQLLIVSLTLGGLALLYVLTVLILIVRTPVEMENWFRPRPCEPFSKALWDSTRFGDPPRYKMANDLVRSGCLMGKSEREVRELLGQPSSEDRSGTEVRVGYDLIAQRRFPARCFLLPSFLFLNMDTWLLEIQCE